MAGSRWPFPSEPVIPLSSGASPAWHGGLRSGAGRMMSSIREHELGALVHLSLRIHFYFSPTTFTDGTERGCDVFLFITRLADNVSFRIFDVSLGLIESAHGYSYRHTSGHLCYHADLCNRDKGGHSAQTRRTSNEASKMALLHLIGCSDRVCEAFWRHGLFGSNVR